MLYTHSERGNAVGTKGTSASEKTVNVRFNTQEI